MRYPWRRFSVLYHVGTLEAQRKQDRGPSLEGPALSVSEYPEEWTHIAKLGGAPTWALTRPRNRFLDVLALTAAQRDTITSWAQRHGWGVHKQVYVAWGYDDELGATVAQYCATQAQAEEEGDLVELQTVLAATTALEAWCGHRIDDAVAFDLVTLRFAEALGWDGAYWDEELAPERYSAPRAGILPAALAHWQKRRLP